MRTLVSPLLCCGNQKYCAREKSKGCHYQWALTSIYHYGQFHKTDSAPSNSCEMQAGS
jgi:hypothetical protein